MGHVVKIMQKQLLRRSNRPIASYVTMATTTETDKKASQLSTLFHARPLIDVDGNTAKF